MPKVQWKIQSEPIGKKNFSVYYFVYKREKGFLFWKNWEYVSLFSNKEEAKNFVQNQVNKPKKAVIGIYDEYGKEVIPDLT